MNSFILGHLGLGDQIICNSIIRNVSKNSSSVLLPVKKHNLLNVKDMLKDLSNIQYLSVLDDSGMLNYYNLAKNYIDNTVAFGIFGKDFLKNVNYFDESFYKQCEIEYEKRWTDFKYIHNQDKQQQLLNEIKKTYIFVHDDASRNLNIKIDYLSTNYNIYKPKHEYGTSSLYTIFDYMSVLKNAEEIHCMDSSFACLIDHIPELYDKKKYIHRYIRKNSENPHYKNNWIMIND